MNKGELSFEINKSIERGDFSKVIRLWEEHGKKYIDPTDNIDKAICDAIADSYTTLNCFSKALFYIDSRISSMKKMTGKEDRMQNNYVNWDYYHGLKSHILYEEKRYFQLYKLILGYKKLDGHNDVYLIKLAMIESLFYKKYFKPFIIKLCLYLSYIIPAMVALRVFFTNKFTTSIIYYAFIVVGVIILQLYTSFYKTKMEMAVSKIFRSIISLFVW